MNEPSVIMAVAAHSEELANEILACGKNVLLCNDDAAEILDIASMKRIQVGGKETSEFFGDLDVAEYREGKGAYKVYEHGSIDNTLILSEKCNSSCVMCPYSDHFRKNAVDVSSDRILELIRYISSYPEHFTITGGEPTLIGEGLFDIMSLLRERFPETTYLFLTNGRIFSCDDYFNRFAETLPNDICFAIPIYGYSPETHDTITRAEGSFSEAVKGMQKLMNAGIKVEIRIVVSKLNCENLSDIAEFICKYLNRAFVVNFVGLEMCGNAARNRERVWIDYPEAFLHMKNAIDILCKNNINVGIYNFPICSVEKEYWHLCRNSISGYKIVYYEQCESCAVREMCGGIFRSTFLLENPEVKPVSCDD